MRSARRQQFVDVVLLADKVAAVEDAVLFGKELGLGTVGAVADHEQADGDLFRDAGEDFHDV